jgi:hypothetical protein
MESNSMWGASSAFKLRRPPITANGFVTDPDPGVTDQLDELNARLSKRIFDPAAEAGGAAVRGLDPKKVLAKELTPRRTDGSWEPNTLLTRLGGKGKDDKITLADYFDKTPKLSELSYEFDEYLRDNWPTLPAGAKAVLDLRYGGIRAYLVGRAYLFEGVTKITGLRHFVFSSPRGVEKIVAYAAIGAGRELIQEKALDVDDVDDDDSQIVNDIVASIKAGHLSLSAGEFESQLLAIVDGNVFDGQYLKLIEKAEKTIGQIPQELKPGLLQYMKSFEALDIVKLSAKNVDVIVGNWVADQNGMRALSAISTSTPEESERDFEVDFFQDNTSMIQVSRSAVKCAAMLYYAMVGGDELSVFDVVNYFTHKYLIRGGVEITDAKLRDDLQAYVFSNRFTDLKTGEILDRTRPAERQMFYRQVFDIGEAPEVDGSFRNVEFGRQWKILMFEAADYLERAQDSPNPYSFVSRGKVAQAVEDLQYNLSTHCTGMANVITPLIYAELNFVIRRIFMHPNVLTQVAPVGSTWWRVVERLYAEMKNARLNATVLYNKAKLGHDIIASIADYNPATFEDDASFSAFISNVDAFITTQSILQQALKNDLGQGPEEEVARPEPEERAAPVPVGAPSASNGNKAPSDDWDF